MTYNLEIEIDCCPYSADPDTFFNTIINIIQDTDNISYLGSAIRQKYSIPNSKFFGKWSWVITLDTEEEVQLITNIFKDKLINYYDNGDIRYASWNHSKLND